MITSTTPFYANRWEIRQHDNGLYEAAEKNGSAISGGLDSFDAAVQWVCGQEAAKKILRDAEAADYINEQYSHHRMDEI